MPELEAVCDSPTVSLAKPRRHKDEILSDLANRANVAQFVSFGPNLDQRHSRINGFQPNAFFASSREALIALLHQAPEHSINLRSFRSTDSKSSKFIYGLTSVTDAESALVALAGEGLFTIANETIDVGDGGVSGVLVGDVIEFAPLDTPRCVEKPGVLSAERSFGLRLLETVYGFPPELHYNAELRVEFSLHPIRRGHLNKHTIVWELEEVGRVKMRTKIRWPNSFSRFLGDKTFGLLVADVLNLPVPATTVFPRRLPPFTLGTATGTGEVWLRTSPNEQTPGKFSTFFGWRDPFKLMNTEDPDNQSIASVLAQESVEAHYSGALIPDTKGMPIIEGVRGKGTEFMLGHAKPEVIPSHIITSVSEVYEQASKALGPVRLEWVYDGTRTWVVQMRRGKTLSRQMTIYPGKPRSWREFEAKDGVDHLRTLIANLREDEGVIIVGEVGITSHLGDLLRKSRIPSWIKLNQLTSVES